MPDTPAAPLRTTPLHATHEAYKARLVPFAGWDMPVEYSGIVDEHLAVRTRAGLFDVSHMGEIEVAGKDALAALQHVTSNDVSKLKIGQIQYSGLMTAEGTFVDDLLVYRFGDDHYLLVVNASNAEKDFAYIKTQIASFGDVAAMDTSARYALLALQGPAARETLAGLTGVDLSVIKYY
jgi:aminomethyltransferase